MPTMKTDVSVLTKEASNFDRIAGELKSAVARVESTAESLASQWKGQAGEAIKAALTAYHETASKEFHQLNDISEKIHAAAAKYAATDEDQASSLASKMQMGGDGSGTSHGGGASQGGSSGVWGGPDGTQKDVLDGSDSDKHADGPAHHAPFPGDTKPPIGIVPDHPGQTKFEPFPGEGTSGIPGGGFTGNHPEWSGGGAGGTNTPSDIPGGGFTGNHPEWSGGGAGGVDSPGIPGGGFTGNHPEWSGGGAGGVDSPGIPGGGFTGNHPEWSGGSTP